MHTWRCSSWPASAAEARSDGSSTSAAKAVPTQPLIARPKACSTLLRVHRCENASAKAWELRERRKPGLRNQLLKGRITVQTYKGLVYSDCEEGYFMASEGGLEIA